MYIKEIQAKTILSKSRIFPYVINPYVGCQHGCSYCYARFMKRFTGHREPWGQFVDVKINAVELLKKEVVKKKPGRVWVSGVCDPYQPLEKKYQLTQSCLQILAERQWPVSVLTRSPLVLRDLDVLKAGEHFEVGMSIGTTDEGIRYKFEPSAPPISARLRALSELHQAGIRTYAMLAPILPGCEELPELLVGKVDFVIIDRMNYHHADWVYRKYRLEEMNTDEYFDMVIESLTLEFNRLGVECQV